MPEEEAADTERAIRPVMHPGTVDTKAITALHQQAYAALRAGVAPWFARLLAQPERGRRLHRLRPTEDAGAHVRRGQQLSRADLAADPHDRKGGVRASLRAAPNRFDRSLDLSPRNLTAHRHAAIHYEANGNPISSRPITSVANCCPGLEVDFRAVWRRLFKGIELREHDNLVVRVDDDVRRTTIAGARPQGRGSATFRGASAARRCSGATANSVMTTTPIKGPAPSDPERLHPADDRT